MSNSKITILMVRSQTGTQYLVVRSLIDEWPDYNIFKISGQDIIEVALDERTKLLNEMEVFNEASGQTLSCTLH